MEVRLKFFGGMADGYDAELPGHWDRDTPPEVVWMNFGHDEKTGYTLYLMTEIGPGAAYRHTLDEDVQPADEIHYERFVTADTAAP